MCNETRDRRLDTIVRAEAIVTAILFWPFFLWGAMLATRDVFMRFVSVWR